MDARSPRKAPCAPRDAPSRYTGGVITAEFLVRAEFWAYRVGVFFILNVLDDPAWLALIFC